MTSGAVGTVGLLGEVLTAFDEAEIRWTLLRGQAGLGVSGRDVDLLVARDDIGRMEDVVFAAGGMALPRSMHPWHRFYVLESPTSGQRITLDVVSELIYSRGLRLHSGLETGCLERRRQDGALYVLDLTDLFWTVLLHCVLDKQFVTERRRAELERAREGVSRPSPGELFFEGLCPHGWSAGDALRSVDAQDWEALAELGRQVSAHLPRGVPTPTRRGQGPSNIAGPRRMVRAAARAMYPVVWRRAGLGVTPHVLDVLEAAEVDATVVSVSRSPGICEVVLLAADDQTHRLTATMKEHRYFRAFGGWIRPGGFGVERVCVISSSRLAMPGPAWEDLRLTSSPIPGRAHCRRASPGATLLVESTAVAATSTGRLAAGRLVASREAWAEAERLATKHGLLPQLELLTPKRSA